MSDYLKAADEARKILRGFKAFEEVATALELAGTSVQAKAEAEAALVVLRSDIATAVRDVADAKAEAERARVAANKATADAKTAADGIVAGARSKADAIVSAAEALAESKAETGQLAQADADTLLALTGAKADALLAEVKDLEARAENARAYLTKLAS